MDESNCAPLNKAPGWDTYLGIAKQLGCCNALCLCEGPFFYVTLTAIYNESVTYCNYLPSLNGSVDAEWDTVVGVVADWCANQDFPPGNFQYSYVGTQNSAGGLIQNGFGTLKELLMLCDDLLIEIALTVSDWIAIAIGLGAILFTLPVTFFGWRTYLHDHRARKKQR